MIEMLLTVHGGSFPPGFTTLIPRPTRSICLRSWTSTRLRCAATDGCINIHPLTQSVISTTAQRWWIARPPRLEHSIALPMWPSCRPLWNLGSLEGATPCEYRRRAQMMRQLTSQCRCLARTDRGSDG